MESPQYVVRIIGTNKHDGAPLNGTGFIVDKLGHVVTCWHVVSQADEITVKLPYNDPWKYQIYKKLENEDIVILESIVPPSIETPYASLHSDWKRDNKPGVAITVWGYSAPDHYTAPQRFDCTISGFSEKYGRIGLNGDVNFGDSGGPVVDANGKVIGIAQARDQNRSGQAMAIPISLLFRIFQQEIYEQKMDIDIEEENFDVFLSYSHLDEKLVKGLTRWLEDDAKLRVWLDRWIILPEKHWQQEISRELDLAKSCAICIGGQTPKGWFRKEIERAITHQSEDDSFRVIPVLLPNAQVNLDDFLDIRTWVDFRNGLENAKEFHRLVSGIRGVPLGRGPQEIVVQEIVTARKELMMLEQLHFEFRTMISEEIKNEYIRKILDRHLLVERR